jgi:agmatine deiminase
MPAEWAPHAATWLAWPHHEPDWPGKFGPVPWIYADIVRLIASAEHVYLFIPPGESRLIRRTLERTGANLTNITLIPQATDRIWTRDSGPIFVTRPGQLAAVDFRFNAWAKYANWKRDDLLPEVAARRLKVPRFVARAVRDHADPSGKPPPRFVLEGGAIDVNGAGCVLTTEECLLSDVQARNPHLNRSATEATLRAYLGVEQILWLESGIAGDDTHGHIDDTARFVNPTTVLACVEPQRSDENHARLKANLRRLAKMRDARGKPLTVAELPMPDPVHFHGQRLPASYANFYICNVGVLVPAFNDPQDLAALKVIEQCFPGRPIVPIYARDLVWGLGTLHCMTQQQPAVPPVKKKKR